jgi:hypothetical protein
MKQRIERLYYYDGSGFRTFYIIKGKKGAVVALRFGNKKDISIDYHWPKLWGKWSSRCTWSWTRRCNISGYYDYDNMDAFSELSIAEIYQLLRKLYEEM